MIVNYLKTALRSLLRNKTFSFINIFGLAIGLAASLMIAMWVFNELSYDRFNKNGDRLFRVERNIQYQDQSFMVPVTGAIYGPTILQNYPEVVNMTRINPMTMSLESSDKHRFSERIIFADTGFLQTFTFPLQQGNAATALTEPRSVVLSPKAAKKYFGTTDVLNKVLNIEWDGELKDFRVTGIFEPLPENKHFDFDVVASFVTLENWYQPERISSWLNNYLYTFILLKDGIGEAQMEQQLDRLAEETIQPAYEGFFKTDDGNKGRLRLNLRRLTDIHLHSGLMWDIEAQGDITTVYVFSVVALLILLIASFNFMSLSSAQAGNRAREVGLRKTLGSTRRQLIRQFLGESVLIALIAFVIALLLMQISLPWFNTLTGKSLSMRIFLQPSKLAVLAVIVLGTGLLSGLYPALFLSSFRPIAVLKGRFHYGRSTFSFRQVLVVLQFVISISLIIGTLIALQQMNYMQNKPLGYDKNNMMILPVESNETRTHYKAFRDDLLSHPQIVSVASSQRVPAERSYSDTGWDTDKQKELFLSKFFAVDFDFLKTYNIGMAAGRAFDEKNSTDKLNRIIINETAAKKLGYSDPKDAIGDKFHSSAIAEELGTEETGRIIGVMKDFHFKSMKSQIEPLTIFIANDWMNRISVKCRPGHDQECIGLVESAWKKHFPNVDFQYEFLTGYLKAYYKDEQKLETILLVFTILAIVIACMGLFGLAMFVAQQKVKEIGVRKALGASVRTIVLMLTTTFTKWVVLANLIAWPLAWYFINEWLGNFEFRIRINPWIFILSGLLALLIAVITVVHRSYRAAAHNPVEALRYE